jgi:hypothetical protein
VRHLGGSETLVRPRKRKEEDSRRFDSATSHDMKCKSCENWHPEWTASPSQYSYCELWHIDTRGTEDCEQVKERI